MSNPVRAQARFVISQYDEDGGCIRDYTVVRGEGQAEVAALLERLEQRRAVTDHALMSMDDALRELEVPEADHRTCGEEISDFINALAGTEGGVDYTQTPFKRAFFLQLCARIPRNYTGSYLERNAIHRQLDVSYDDLAAMEQIVVRLSDSAAASEERLDQAEVKLLLRKIAVALGWARESAKLRQPEPA